MSDYLIREYRKEDIRSLTELWVRVFDEDERMLTAFFAALEQMGSGLAAVMDGKIVGAGYALTGQKLVSGGESLDLGLIYGIAVDPQYRSHGIGRAIVRAAAELARERGADIICCEPANQGLVKWYDQVLGLKTAVCRQERSFPAANYLPCSPVSAEEYALRRHDILSGKSHVSLSDSALGFEEDMLKIYGGGFYAVGDGIAAAYVWENHAIVRELLGSEKKEEKAASSLAYALSAKQAKLYAPSKTGQAYILSDSPLPPDCVWNLSFN